MKFNQQERSFASQFSLPFLLSLGEKGSMAQFLLITGYLVGILCLDLTLGFPTAQGSEASKPTTSLTMFIDCPKPAL